MAEDFREAGYRTAAFVSGFPLNRRFGLDRGFDTYDDHLPRGNDPRRTAYVERTADRTTDAALRWLEAPRRRPPAPWFLWVHYFDPHAPYEAPGELPIAVRRVALRRRDRVRGRAARAPAARVRGARTGRADARPRDRRPRREPRRARRGHPRHLRLRLDPAGAVDHGGPGHPRGPRRADASRGASTWPRRSSTTRASPARATWRGGRSAGRGRGETLDDAPAYAESLHAQLQYGWAPLHAWRTAQLQAHRGAARRALRPRDRRRRGARTVAAQDAARRREHAARAAGGDGDDDARRPRRRSTRRRPSGWRALGYVGGRRRRCSRPPRRRVATPRTGSALVTRLGRNGMTVARTEPQKAIRELTALLAEDPGMLVVPAHAGRGLRRGRPARRPRSATCGRSRSGAPSPPRTPWCWATTCAWPGDAQEAVAVLERTAARTRSSRSRCSRSRPSVSSRRTCEGAAAAYEKVLAIDPDHVEALRGLGRPRAHAGRRRRGRDALRTDRGARREGRRGASRSSASCACGRGGPTRAIALFRRAVEREPKNAEALLYLAGALASNGRARGGRALLRAGPRGGPAHDDGAQRPRPHPAARSATAAGAATAFRESLRLDPRQPDVAEALAGAWPALAPSAARAFPRSRTAPGPRPPAPPTRSVTSTITS